MLIKNKIRLEALGKAVLCRKLYSCPNSYS